ncbi:oligosaccharide flippase family protein [Methylobacterium oxalidis]|uniref:oligosaccharide flippase family protein n=1 Tax=Methylobacterium oxalidis TaxID=944322 RepID=UPI003315F707
MKKLVEIPRKMRSVRLPLGRGAILVGNVSEAALPLARNIVLAHILSPDQFGLAFSLAIVVALAELLAEFGIYEFTITKTLDSLVKNPVYTLQSLALARAILIGAGLVLIGPFVATLLHAESHAGVYQMLSLIVLVRGLENLSVKQAIARFEYVREATVVIASQCVAAAVTITVAIATGSFQCMFWGLLASAATVAILSNLLAPRPLRWRWDKPVVQSAMAFGRPLVLNGVALSASSADRLAIGSLMSPAQLAHYNVVLGTALVPRWIIVRFMNLMFMPLLAASASRPQSERNLQAVWFLCLTLTAFFYALFLASFGDVLLGFAFGSQYMPSRYLMSLVALNVFVKLCMALPGPAAYVSGRTGLIALGSLLSATALLPAIIGLYLMRSTEVFILLLTVFEFASLVAYLIISTRNMAVAGTFVCAALSGPVILLLSLAVCSAAFPDINLATWCICCVLAGVVFVVWSAISMINFGFIWRILKSDMLEAATHRT